jgi:hypothetical protein
MTIVNDTAEFNFDRWSALLELAPGLSLDTTETDDGIIYSVKFMGKAVTVETSLFRLNVWIEYHAGFGLNLLKQKIKECQGATLRWIDDPSVNEYWSTMTMLYVGMRNRKIAQRNAIQEKLGASA